MLGPFVRSYLQDGGSGSDRTRTKRLGSSNGRKASQPTDRIALEANGDKRELFREKSSGKMNQQTSKVHCKELGQVVLGRLEPV
jgi:hypothetical protein